MSFHLICEGCGAASGPSVGVCPFCKTVMADQNNPDAVSIQAFLKMHTNGRLEQALEYGSALYRSKPELKSDLNFALAFVRVLLEAEAPSSQIRTVLAEAQLAHPEHTEILDFLEILEAKKYLKQGTNDAGELLLRNLIRRSPQNPYAYFILGAHIFWSDKDPLRAIPFLETCVRLQPNLLRAWGCLGAIYKKLGNDQLASHAFRRCEELETDAKMREFFRSQAKAS